MRRNKTQDNDNLISFRLNEQAKFMLDEINLGELSKAAFCQKVLYKYLGIESTEPISKEQFHEVIGHIVDYELDRVLRQRIDPRIQRLEDSISNFSDNLQTVIVPNLSLVFKRLDALEAICTQTVNTLQTETKPRRSRRTKTEIQTEET
jgi:hypothetical protein